MNARSTLGLMTAALALPLIVTIANAQTAPKYSAKVPPYITTPDKVESVCARRWSHGSTRLGSRAISSWLNEVTAASLSQGRSRVQLELST
jgi:hypothetical protein